MAATTPVSETLYVEEPDIQFCLAVSVLMQIFVARGYSRSEIV